jgi:hypothetical protein
MARKNNPLAAQQPAPLFANDPNGFWGAAVRSNSASGLGSILPAGTVLQSDIAVKGRLLGAQIGWQSVTVRWKGCELQASISDAQFFLALEQGGDTQQGRITLLITKLQFTTGFPTYNDTFFLLAAGQWHQFVVVETIGQHDDNEPGLLLYLEKDQDDTGN